MSNDIRETAKKILTPVLAQGDITSSGPKAQLFTTYTNTPHATMLANWKTGGIMTACNGFVGWYSVKLLNTNLGMFPLAQHLVKIGKADAWIKSTPDVRPKYGDICRHTAYHVGVSLDFDGDHWIHVDAGQGGPKRNKETKELNEAASFDVLRKTRGADPYDYKKLEGWVDIEIFTGGAQKTPMPGWLAGWWNVSWRGQTYYYYFDGKGEAKWTGIAPQNTSQPPAGASDTGKVAVGADGVITITWSATGTVEKCTKSPVTGEKMGGTWNDKELITTEKM